MKIKKNIAVSETGFLFNPATGDSFATNEIGAEIITLMQEGHSFEDIKDKIIEKYNVTDMTFERDWVDFLTQLKDYNLLEIKG